MSASSRTCRYLLYFANEHIEFKIAELKSLASLYNIKLDLHEACIDKKDPFLVVDLPSEDGAIQIMSRTLLVRSAYELWGQGKSHEEMYRNLAAFHTDRMAPYFSANTTFKIMVESFNKTITQKEKVQRIEELPQDILKFEGKVNLKNPVHIFTLMEYYGHVGTTPPDKPLAVYFGRWICDGQRDKISYFNLQKRHFIANTTMDPGLSLIMSNLARVKQNSLVFDPFVGTGSLLVSAAHHGAYIIGTDIDYLLLHAKSKPSRARQKKRASDESVQANFGQYRLESQYLDVLVADASCHKLWRPMIHFDAIITDPPYGIREGAKRVGKDAEDEEKSSLQDEFPKRIPRLRDYHLSDIFLDLLDFSAKHLQMHGRLVYWLPVDRLDYKEENLPSHPCLQLIANCEQVLNSKVSRRLITMEKVREFQENGGMTARVEVDHYQDATFRERYFRPTNLTNDEDN
ncbi:hypothetical protein CHS0354_015263 [Potamilus streckersoni]|uniref:tRNA (guanine(10)-N(2))-methyltransferase TRMT11 n=1 Tax=Potamilus streckersoni TaxID=2493646 RepID=A0AAE0RUC5_9BIVA|nr:hypothetical protein CHS0354_015263 [Potamilus streckersoni]